MRYRYAVTHGRRRRARRTGRHGAKYPRGTAVVLPCVLPVEQVAADFEEIDVTRFAAALAASVLLGVVVLTEINAIRVVLPIPINCRVRRLSPHADTAPFWVGPIALLA